MSSSFSLRRRTEKPLRLPLAVAVLLMLAVSTLVLSAGRFPALARHVGRLPRMRHIRRAPDVEEVVADATDEIVRRPEVRPDPGEPIQGWSCAGPIAVNVASAGGVIGVCGTGAVRAALKALTASSRHTVIITADCARELYGEGAPPEQATQAATLDEAIGLVHAASVARIRNEEDGGSEEDGRQIWLCAKADAQQARLRSLFQSAGRYGVRAVLLGYWPYGLSLTVDDDGRILSAPPNAEELTGSYLATVPPVATDVSFPRALPETVGASTDVPSSGAEASRAAMEATTGLRLLILGPEAIQAGGDELPGLMERRFSWEVATYLACHPDGATADAIIEDLWPSEPLMSARKRFTDAVYHLRRALRAASDNPQEKFVLLRMNRYRLDENMLSVDLWDFNAAVIAGRSASDNAERLAHYRRAVELYRGEFVHVGDGLWAETFRHDVRRKALAAFEGAASLLEQQNPAMAITMLEGAREIMPWSEEADRRIMQIYQRLHRMDDVRIAYEALTERLARLGEKPSAETSELLRAMAAGDSMN
jgi:DNA-binding SARP family transcriptional activator